MLDGLHIGLLGEQELTYRGARIALPPSKKTRALLGYLVLSERAHRRERLCELLWDVADDPRAALRWSLSKLRELVDHDGTARLLSDRQEVRLELEGVDVDVFAVRQLQGADLTQVSTEQLEAALSRFRGELLEGLELPDFHAYYAFCLVEREQMRRLHGSILCELLERHVGQPQLALPLARKWVDLDPESERARARLLQLLHASGREREATIASSHSQRLIGGERDGSARPASRSRERESCVELRGESQLPPLVGRRAELARLQALLTTEQVRVVLLGGAAGLGKSKLLTTLQTRAQASGHFVYEGAAHEVEPGFPFAPFRALFAQLGVSLEEAHPQAAVHDPDHARRSRAEFFERVGHALLQRLTQSPRAALLVLEDVHWLDEPSALLVHHLVRACAAQPLALVLSARSGELADNAPVRRLVRALRGEGCLDELLLPPLTREETTTLVALVAGGANAAVVYEQSAGNPLFALELARAVETSVEQVPPSISQLVRERMDTLSSELRELLRWASVLGASFALLDVEQLSGLAPQDFVEALEQLERLGWVVGLDGACQPDCARFAHAVVHRAVYDGLSGPRSRLMHARAARLMSEREPSAETFAAELARHAVLAGDAAMAVQACLRAGRRCLHLFAASDAAALARRGLGYVGRLSPPESCLLELELHELLLQAQRSRDVDVQARRIGELSARALALGHVDHARRGFFMHAFLRWEAGQIGDAQHFAREAERCSRLGGPAERLRGLADATCCLVTLQRDLPLAHAFVLEAEALIAAGEAELACIAVAHGMLALHRGELDDASRTLRRGAAMARAEGDRANEFIALDGLIELAIGAGAWDEAGSLAAALAAQAEHREGSEAPYGQALHALTQHALDRADTRGLERALVALAEVDAKQRTAIVLTHWAELLAGRGQHAEARARAEQALQLAQAVDRRSEVALSLAVIARVSQASGDAAAHAHAQAGLSELELGSLSARAKRAVSEAGEAAPRERARASTAAAGLPARVAAARPAGKKHGTRDRRAGLRGTD